MKIRDIEFYITNPGDRNYTFLRVLTDEGITGVGAPYNVGPDNGVLGALKDMKEWFIGQDPTRIEWLMRRAKNTMRFVLGNISYAALSGIEIALWDIVGKSKGLPIHALLGGNIRDKVRVYHGLSGDTPEELKENALSLMEEGYTAFKMSPFPSGIHGNADLRPEDVRSSKMYYVPVWQNMPWNQVIRKSSERLAAVRDAVGSGPEIAIDVHAVFRDAVKASQLVRELSQYRLLFYEEPVTPHNLTTTARLRGELNAPLATGECLYSISTFAQLMELGAVDIIQPDVLICGGILEMKKMSSIAEMHYVTVAPHNPIGLISTAASVHLSANIPNFKILEFHSDHKRPSAVYAKNIWKPKNGYFEIPKEPGLGMDLDFDRIKSTPPGVWHRGFPTDSQGAPAFM